MSKDIFNKALEHDDFYDSKTTLSAELGNLINDLPAENKIDIAKHIINKEYGENNLKKVLGFIIFIIGIVMFYLGINDIISFEISSQYVSAKLINASPGAFICLLGFFIIILAKSKIKK